MRISHNIYINNLMQGYRLKVTDLLLYLGCRIHLLYI